MTRRLAERPPRRLLRMRPAGQRVEHGQDLALVTLRADSRHDADAAQRADQRALRALEAELHALRRDGAEPPAGATTPSPRRVLCVGGRARQMPVYRELVERGGDRFDHVDGADPACLPRLRAALADADLVILQPGYACQGACSAVEQHCARTAVRCVQLDKACALGFARSLAEATASGTAAPSHPDYRDGGRTFSAR